jgi:transcriptional regulator with XRE-family HTH domain
MNRILEVLQTKKIKQIALATKLDVAKSTVSQWCSNTAQPAVSTLNKIADVLNCEIAELLISNKNIKK